MMIFALTKVIKTEHRGSAPKWMILMTALSVLEMYFVAWTLFLFLCNWRQYRGFCRMPNATELPTMVFKRFLDSWLSIWMDSVCVLVRTDVHLRPDDKKRVCRCDSVNGTKWCKLCSNQSQQIFDVDTLATCVVLWFWLHLNITLTKYSWSDMIK